MSLASANSNGGNILRPPFPAPAADQFDNEENLMTLKEFGAACKVTERWLRNATRWEVNPLPYIQMGRYIRLRPKEARAWLMSLRSRKKS